MAELDFDVSTTDVAVIVIVAPPEGSVAGAVYMIGVPLAVKFAESVPHGAVGQDTAQDMPRLLGSYATLAVSCIVALACTVAVPGETETKIAGNVTLAEAFFVGSAAEAAVTTTVILLAGGAAGAV